MEFDKILFANDARAGASAVTTNNLSPTSGSAI